MIRKRSIALLGWGAILVLLAPVLHTLWVSFSPDSFLTPPTNVWSLKWYQAFVQDRRWVSAVLHSLVVAGLAAALAVMAGVATALSLDQLPRARQRLLKILLLLPALIPPAALGFALLPLVFYTGLWGTTLVMVLVHATVGLPIAFLIIRSCLFSQLRELEAAAAGLGASQWTVLQRVTLPLLAPVLLAAGSAVFVVSLNESVVSIFLATPTNETLPAVVWPQLRYAPSPMVAVASCVTAVIGMIGLLIVHRMLIGQGGGLPINGTSASRIRNSGVRSDPPFATGSDGRGSSEVTV